MQLVVSFMEVWTKELGGQDFQGGLGTPAMALMYNDRVQDSLWNKSSV